jgi:1-acyl-sn-glycerol-3-phosphate acyltransferase
MIIILRSVAFNVLFYLNTAVFAIIGLPTFVMPYQAIVEVAKTWGRVNLFLLRVVAGVKFEVRGRENIPPGAVIVAAKHQSAWETFALMHLFDSPFFIMKRELQWIPVFGWLTIKARMVGIDRDARAGALIRMTEHARTEFARGRQLIIFPEGTRRPVGAEPSYKSGIAFLYSVEGLPCLPMALNSGLFWPRRSILRQPGTVVVEIMPPIPPRLGKKAFMARLEHDIETASSRLVAEAQAKH